MEHEDLLDASQDILALSTPVESPMTFSKRIIDRISTSSRRVTETVPNTQSVKHVIVVISREPTYTRHTIESQYNQLSCACVQTNV